jgi:transglutaminase-like putative cysteine protease
MPRKTSRIFYAFVAAVFFPACSESPPVISSISPRIGSIGDRLTITGENFGAERNESYITVGGVSPTTSSYYSWTDTAITVRVPDCGESGMVYVYRGNQKSRPVLFSMKDALPELPETSAGLKNSPVIREIRPAIAAIGELVTLAGSGFGPSREGRAVYFTWDTSSQQLQPAAAVPALVEVKEREAGYDFWSDREIRVRVPDGAGNGNIAVHTPQGQSSFSGALSFSIAGKPGAKTIKDKRNYTILYSVDLRVAEAETPNTLYLWLPHPATSASQANRELLSRSLEPFVDNFRGTALYKFSDLLPEAAPRVSVSYLVEVYTVETQVKPELVKSVPATGAKMYALPSLLVPSDNEAVQAAALAIIGRERNPYLRARRIYDWLLKEGGIQEEARGGGAVEALETKSASAYTAALLFCALARAAEIPANPVSGVLIDRYRATKPHYWAEFWLDGFGWVPVDPALGAEKGPQAFSPHEDPAAYYFGSIDNQRIAFSYGETALSPMDPRGRVSSRSGVSLQNLWEEASGGLQSYSSYWSDIQVTGVYVN